MLFTLLITSLYMMAVISPGPDFFIVTKNALNYSRRVAIVTAVGISIGVAIHTSYSVLALDYIRQHSLHMVSLIRFVGAAYLIYLGGMGLFGKSSLVTSNHSEKLPDIQLRYALVNGFLCNLLNPKAALFFISIFTFIAEAHISLMQRAAYGMEMTILTLLWFVFIAIAITTPYVRFRLNKIQHKLISLLSLLLLLMGCFLLVHY